jgi:phosphatidylinositol-bisphosphatase
MIVSDHKPVHALFRVQAKVTNRAKQMRVQQEIIAMIDRWENSMAPQVTVSTQSLSFSSVRYDSVAEQTLVIRNTGTVVAKFRFIPKLEDKSYCKVSGAHHARRRGIALY